MQDMEPGAATEVRGILDEVIATHANQIGTHHESCYLRHAGCLAVRLRDELGPKPTAAAATTSATTAERKAPTDAEKRELIAEGRAAFSEATMSEAFDVIARLADALEGTFTEPEWEWALKNNEDSEPWSHYYESRESLEGNLAALADRDDETLVRRRKAGPWEVTPG